MAEFSIVVNGIQHDLELDPQMPLLWVLRDILNLTGTKYSCGQGLCGSCTVHLDGVAVRSCITSVSSINDREIITIEGLVTQIGLRLKESWMEESVPQCGYCQPGQIMTAAAFLSSTPNPDDEQIIDALQENLCRCGTYLRIRQAVRRAAEAGGA